jgi:2-methylcitrate dehydratase PrpD
LSLGQISRVEVHTYKAAAVLDEQQPQTPIEAQFSVPFCAALAIDERRSGGPLSTPDFELERIWDPELRRVAQTVVVDVDASSEAAFPAKRLTSVTIVDTAGNSYQHSVDYPRGMPENPMSGSEIRAKYRGLAHAAIGARAQDVESLVDGILEHDTWSHLLSDAIGSTGDT